MKAKEIEGEAAKVHRIRITLTSRNVKNLEKGARPTVPSGTSHCERACARSSAAVAAISSSRECLAAHDVSLRSSFLLQCATT